MYNLKEDLSEKNNLVDKLPDKAKELHTMLKLWRKDVNAQMSKPNADYKGE